MINKTKLIMLTVLLGSLLAPMASNSMVRAGHGGVEQDDCQSGLIVNEGHSGCVEPTPENDPDNCAAAGSPDRIEQCLGGFGEGDAGGPAGPGFTVGERGELPVGEAVTFTCSDAERDNEESEDIYCQLLRFTNVLSIGVAVVAAITVTVAGVQYIISRGDPNKTAQAINRLIQVGLAIVVYVFGWAFMNWLIPGGAL